VWDAARTCSLIVPDEGWAARSGDGSDGSVLELWRSSKDVVVRVFRAPGPDRLDDAVAKRRRKTLESYDDIVAIDEERFFLDPHALIPASLTHYQGAERDGRRLSLWSLVVDAQRHAYEAVGYTWNPALAGEVAAVVRTFALAAPDAGGARGAGGRDGPDERSFD
jgi:hypothetical protein